MSNSWVHTRRRASGAAALLLILSSAGWGRAVEPEELRRGLVTTFDDDGKPPAEVVRLEPTVALALGQGEAPHPRLAADGGVS